MLCSFLGLAGYNRRFIKDFGALAAPLTQLLKEGFPWNEQAKMAFQALKQALTTGPILALPDFARLFVVECDASSLGFGVVLHQDDRPITFFNRVSSPHYKHLAAYEHELIGLIQAIRHWRPYLWGSHSSSRRIITT